MEFLHTYGNLEINKLMDESNDKQTEMSDVDLRNIQF